MKTLSESSGTICATFGRETTQCELADYPLNTRVFLEIRRSLDRRESMRDHLLDVTILSVNYELARCESLGNGTRFAHSFLLSWIDRRLAALPRNLPHRPGRENM